MASSSREVTTTTGTLTIPNGVTLTGPASSGTAATLTNAFGALVYDDTLTTPVADQGVSYHYFGGTQSVTAGTLTIVWNASGIFALTL